MKEQADLVRGWLRKARSDSDAVLALVDAGTFDAACFHAQQAAEKYLKAFLIYHAVASPYTHNLVKLVDLCIPLDASFRTLLPVVTPLVPYAVELRYDAEFWPDEHTAREAQTFASDVARFVLARIPEAVGQDMSGK